ncbi:ABC transporter permease [Candidatus Pacearchaeota archaeon]|nr:ABC transporter permease [Candidatus Pacearchaeota archaeon]
MIADFFGLALNSIKKRKLRSGLTIIGIIIGIAAIVALISIGQGLQNYIDEEFSKLGSNKIIVMGKSTAVAGGPAASSLSASPLTKKDVETINRVNDVRGATGILIKSAKISYKGETKYLMLAGISTNSEAMKLLGSMEPIEAEVGRELKQTDTYSALIRYGVAHDVFKKEVDVKDRILINDREFNVVGIVGKLGNSFADNTLAIPLDIARELFNEPELVSEIIVEVKETDAQTTEEIKNALRKARNEKEGEETFEVQTTEELRASLGSILSIITVVLAGIAAISLLVGGIGIMNSMYTNVLERTREIGIMKAVGAKNSHILLIFLIEAGMFGLVGGVIGAALGTGLALMVSNIATNFGFSFLSIKINYILMLGALAFSFIIGCISGILPAIRASKLKPVEALRYE